ncbi:hypothetical protein DPM13_01755 [Paracoccus mutanolyticus]|uniref:Alanine dehydrogenase/pyridine nucleotide transhydrogenase N-terminal domain-containing protein n=1 Tax=Paracoccus mutanolyticus TaxID=1499308 RepID=A0ABM6WUJ3_9RHOB|nr:NAD-binding protein [Paracoccus mutanolyticus]AWX94345.1 hypothetical protein DPM13_01755 [Paracoccus mutanolyticus]
MKIGALKESYEGEARVAVTPSSAAHLKKLGHEVFVESGAGVRAGFSDAAYQAAGVTVAPTAAALINDVDVVVKVRPPELAEIAQMRSRPDPDQPFRPAQTRGRCARRDGSGTMARRRSCRAGSDGEGEEIMANIAGIPVYKEIGATSAPAVPQDRAPVVIVGAGPVGLAMALDLGRRGHAVTVLHRDGAC